MTKVFIDGSAGTTGLRIRERLGGRSDLELLTIPEELRKDPAAREEIMNRADVVFLCLPDAAATSAVSLIHGDTAVIDTSTAHRTSDGWTYGFPELGERRTAIAKSRRIANPGCHASGFLVLTEPLVRAGLLRKDAKLTCFSVTGYSGGGKSMIAEYEAEERPKTFDSPRQYALGQTHKHLPEMQLVAGLETPPVFCPIVAGYYSGMCVTVPVFRSDLLGTAEDVRTLYRDVYTGPVVRYSDWTEKMIAGNELSGYDDMIVTVQGNDERILLISVFDNLGKGASGAAIQNMNILLGVPETTGLNICKENV